MQVTGDEDALLAIEEGLVRWSERFVVILVEPLYEGNIGSVARLAKNFGLERMVLVNPPGIGDTAIAYSMHGSDVLSQARTVHDFDEACDMVDCVVGTSGISSSTEKNHGRRPMTPAEFAHWTRDSSGTVGIALGREDKGLSNDEIRRCDLLVTIPANPEYPVLNISHAAGILFYELWKDRMPDYRRSGRTVNRGEVQALMRHYSDLMRISRVPEHKVPISMVNFRRMIARAAPNIREFYSLMGTFSRAMDYKRTRSPFSDTDASGQDE